MTPDLTPISTHLHDSWSGVEPYNAQMGEAARATVVASCYRAKLAYRSGARLRAAVRERTSCAAWSDFEAAVADSPLCVPGSFTSGISFWPGGAQVAAEFRVTGDVPSVRHVASSIAKKYELGSVRVNFEVGSEAELSAFDLWLSDWRLEYRLAKDSAPARAEAVWWLTREAPGEMPGGRVVGDRLIIDAGLGFVAAAHRAIADRFGRPCSVAQVLVERWGGDGVQRGFFREQRIERATDSELGRILRT